MILDAFRLDGKVALVTGAGRGLGRAMAEGLAEAGSDLVLLDRGHAQQTAEAVSALGRRCVCQKRDLEHLDAPGAHEVVDECVRQLGGLDILVNNAGVIHREQTLEVDENAWRRVLAVNLDASFYLSQAAARYFIKQKRRGRIINVASMLSFQGGSQVASYAASKSGIVGLTRSMANEWAAHGIGVNAIAPGYMETQLTTGIREDPQRAQDMLKRIPAGRWGLPQDLKGAIIFLASDASSYVQGTTIPIDGGWLSS